MFGRKYILLVLIGCLLHSSKAHKHWEDQDMWGGNCQNTSWQSPIDINTKEVQFCPPQHWLRIDAPCEDFEYMPMGPSLMSEAMNVNFLTYSHIDWNMTQTSISIYASESIEFHSPSEHAINGKHFALEMQLVHKYYNLSQWFIPNDTAAMNYTERDNEEQYAIMSLLFYEDEEIEEDVFDSFNPEDMDNMTNLRAAFECVAERFYFHYKGSKTSPPCQDDILWFILRDPLPIRSEHVDYFKDKINMGEPNNRETQDLGDRDVYLLNERFCGHYLLEKYHDHIDMNMSHMNMSDMHRPMMWDSDSDSDSSSSSM